MTALKPCPNRDTCPCVGPTWLCYHGWAGPTFGTSGTVAAADGSALVVYSVTAEDCLRCPLGKPD